MTDSNDDAERGTEPSRRGAPRPHKNISKSAFHQRIQRLLDQRIQKLQKRVDKAKAQLEDATRHLEECRQESALRMNEESE